MACASPDLSISSWSSSSSLSTNLASSPAQLPGSAGWFEWLGLAGIELGAEGLEVFRYVRPSIIVH